MNGWASPSQGCFIHNVVVQKGEIMKDLDGNGQRYNSPDIGFVQGVGQKCQQRTESFAPQRHHVAQWLIESVRLDSEFLFIDFGFYPRLQTVYSHGNQASGWVSNVKSINRLSTSVFFT